MRFIALSILLTMWSCCVILIVSCFILYFPERNRGRIYFLENECKTCGQAQVLAIQDFDRGIYRIILGGIDSRGYEIRNKILQQEYKIEALYDGCVGTTDEVYCYSNMMIRLLAKKYGWDFYDSVLDKSREELARIRNPKCHQLAIPPYVKNVP